MTCVFDPATLQEIVTRCIGADDEETLFEEVIHALQRRFPSTIEKRREWIVTTAGGGLGMLSLLFASLSEYLILFGTPIGTEGYSGRHAVDIWDFMLVGEMHYFLEGQPKAQICAAGQSLHIPKRVTKGYRLSGPAWMLEYVRGPIPLMLPFGFGTSLSSGLDFRAIWQQSRDYILLCTHWMQNRRGQNPFPEKGHKASKR